MGMTRPPFDSATLARQSERVLRRDQRRVARDAARNLVVETLDALARDEPPDWFSGEQDIAYRAEIAGHRRRICGVQSSNVHRWAG